MTQGPCDNSNANCLSVFRLPQQNKTERYINIVCSNKSIKWFNFYWNVYEHL